MTSITAPRPAPIAIPVISRQDFSAGIERLLPALQGYARKLTRDPDAGEDLVQDTLTRAWAARAQFRVGTNLGAWLFRILRNGHLSNRRRAWRQQQLDPTADEDLLPVAADQETALLFADLHRALADLPSGHRDALLLVTQEGLTYDEAAVTLGIAGGTVRSRVSRARTAITAFLDGQRHAPEPSETPTDPAAPPRGKRALYRKWKAMGGRMIG